MAPTGPRLKSHVRLLERSADEIQLRLPGGVDLVLSPASDATRAVLAALDGRHGREDLASIARSCAGTAAEVDDLLGQLDAQHLLVHPGDIPAPVRSLGTTPDEDDAELRAWVERGLDVADAARRTHRLANARIVLHGRGSLVDSVRNHLDPRLSQVWCTQADAGAFDLAGPSDLAIVIASEALDPTPLPPSASVRAVLPVVATGSQVAIGPLWASRSDPCPHCLDRYRSDRDPAWPRLLAQLTRNAPDGLPAPCHAERHVAALAAGVVGHIAHNHLLGWSAPSGIAFEVGGLWPTITYRRWPVHPTCPGHRAHPARTAIMAG